MVYPNPSTNTVFADLSSFEQGKDLTIRIYNTDGRLVYETAEKGGLSRVEIGTSMLPSGLYLLKVHQNQMFATAKISIR